MNDDSSYTVVTRLPELDRSMANKIDKTSTANLKKIKQSYNQEDAELVGPVKFANGVYYLGEIKEGVKNGYAKIITENSDYYYEGEVKNNQPNGYGVFLMKSGEFYLGDWKDGKANGLGKFNSSEGVSQSKDSNLRFSMKESGRTINLMVQELKNRKRGPSKK